MAEAEVIQSTSDHHCETSTSPSTSVIVSNPQLLCHDQNTNNNVAHDDDQPSHKSIQVQTEMEMEMDMAPHDSNDTTDSSSEWMFLVTNLVLEIVSALLDQFSSPCYALLGMLISLLAAIICVLELVLKGSREEAVFRRSSSSRFTIMWCFYYPSQPNNGNSNSSRLFLSFSDTYGLACALCQFIFSAIKYGYLIHHSEDPVKFSVLPVIFLACLAGSKFIATNYPQTTIEAN